MKLYEHLPDSVTVNRRSYNVDLDFRNVLRMMDTMGRQDLLPEARDYLALKCVMKRPPRNAGLVLAAVKNILFPAQKTTESGPKITSFEQDADLIRAAFRQNYGIDLYRDKVHWLEFTGLLGALPEGSKYTEVLGIRARPMPKPTKYNREERQALAKAKAHYALRLDEEEAAQTYQNGLRLMAESLLMLADAAGGEQ